MGTFAEEKSRRQRALRAVRAQERKLDTKLEVMERAIQAQMTRKTILTSESGANIATKWSSVVEEIKKFEVSLRDYLTVLAD